MPARVWVTPKEDLPLPDLYYSVSQLHKSWRELLPAGFGKKMFSIPEFYLEHCSHIQYYSAFHPDTCEYVLVMHVLEAEAIRARLEKRFKNKTIPRLQDWVAYREVVAVDLSERNRHTVLAKRLQKRNSVFRDVGLLAQKRFTVLVVDIEGWEEDPNVILEVGWSRCVLEHGQIVQRSDAQWIVKKHAEKRNSGRFGILDRKDGFLFGSSSTECLSRIGAAFMEELDKADVLVGHALVNDLAWLDSVDGVTTSKAKLVADTADMWSAKVDTTIGKLIGLEDLLSELGVEFDSAALHNGGNDAHYTMDAFIQLIG